MDRGGHPIRTDFLQAKKDYTRAQEQFTHLLTTVPGDFGAHYNPGILAMRSGHWEEARREPRAAVDADPDSTQAREALEKLTAYSH